MSPFSPVIRNRFVALLCMLPAGVALAEDPPQTSIRFDEPIRIPVGEQPRHVAAGDLDGDGHVDLVSSNLGRRDASVVLSRGKLQFAPERPLAITPRTVAGNRLPGPILLADLNGDGAPDLVTLGESDPQSNLPGGDALTILINRRRGQFSPPTPYPSTHLRFASIQAVDVNLDSRLDLVLAALPSNGPGALHPFSTGSGYGATRWTVQPSDQRGELPAFCFADFNGDGIIDVAVPGGPTSVDIWPGPSFNATHRNLPFNLTWSDGRKDIGGFEPVAMVAGQLDDDEPMDLVVAVKQPGDDGLIRLVRIRQAVTRPNMKHLDSVPDLQDVAYLGLHDLNHDEKPDLVVVGRAAGSAQRQLIVAEGIGEGRFAEPAILDMPAAGPGIAFADLDGDDKLELIVPSQRENVLLVFPNKSEQSESSSSSQQQVAQADPQQDQEQPESEQEQEDQQEQDQAEQDQQHRQDRQDSEDSQDAEDAQDQDADAQDNPDRDTQQDSDPDGDEDEPREPKNPNERRIEDDEASSDAQDSQSQQDQQESRQEDSQEPQESEDQQSESEDQQQATQEQMQREQQQAEQQQQQEQAQQEQQAQEDQQEQAEPQEPEQFTPVEGPAPRPRRVPNRRLLPD